MEMDDDHVMDAQDERTLRTAIDTNQFIKEIKDNPGIWNYSSPEYASMAARAMAWEKIFRKFFDEFDDMDQASKKMITRQLQRKWKTLRDCFSRYLSQRKKCPQGRVPKPYAYFQQLSFLLKPKKGSLEPIRAKNRFTKKKLTNRDDRQDSEEEEEGDEDGHTVPIKVEPQDDLEEVPLAQIARTTDPLENQPRQSSTSDIDEDKYFLLSLCRDFKKISDDLKLDAKGEIIDVLKKFCTMSRMNQRGQY